MGNFIGSDRARCCGAFFFLFFSFYGLVSAGHDFFSHQCSHGSVLFLAFVCGLIFFFFFFFFLRTVEIACSVGFGVN